MFQDYLAALDAISKITSHFVQLNYLAFLTEVGTPSLIPVPSGSYLSREKSEWCNLRVLREQEHFFEMLNSWIVDASSGRSSHHGGCE